MEHSRTVAEEFFAWEREEQEKNPVPKSMFGVALTYTFTLNQRDWLMNVFLDGRLRLSNNRAERAVRPFAIGRKTGCSVTRPMAPMPAQRYIPLLRRPKRMACDLSTI